MDRVDLGQVAVERKHPLLADRALGSRYSLSLLWVWPPCGFVHRNPPESKILSSKEIGRLRTSVDALPMSGGQGVAGSNFAGPTQSWSDLTLAADGRRVSLDT